jgi:enoyl-CoA hydratase/carnithine racemase
MNITIAREGNIAILTLNRPERRNALSLELMRELLAGLEAIRRDREVRAVILEAAGKVFCSGHDLSEMTGRDVAEYREIFDVCSELMQKLQSIPQPVIAAVQGIATAAGCQLVASCDLAVAAEEAAFATPGVKIGLFCSTPMVPLSRAIGRKRALEMLLTGDLIGASTALDWGLVNRVVPSEQLDAAVAELVERITRSSPLTVGIGKEAFYAQVELDEQRAYDLTKSVMAMNSLAADAQEGICAFLEKREARWSGK